MTLRVEAMAVAPFMENSYLVGDEGEAWLIDPGGAVPDLARRLEQQGWRAQAIVLTHGHIDHAAGAAQAQHLLGAPLWMHAADRPWIEGLAMQAQMFGLPEPGRPVVDRWLSDGDLLHLGGHPARVVHTPGHTEGGICLHFSEDRVLFTGDTLFVNSIGRTDLPGGDPQAIARSIRDRLFPLGDEVVFYPGHGPSGTLGRERRRNPFVGDGADR